MARPGWKNVEHVDVGAREQTRGYRTDKSRGGVAPPGFHGNVTLSFGLFELTMLVFSLSLSILSFPVSHSPRIATAGGSVSPPKNHISRYFPQTEGKNYSVSRKLISQPGQSLFPSFISLRCSFFPLFSALLSTIMDHLHVSSAIPTPPIIR